MKSILLLTVLLPVLAAPAVYWKRENARLRDGLTAAVTLLALLGALTVAIAPTRAEIPGFCGLGAVFASGGFGTVFALLGALVFFLSALAAPSYFAGEPRVGRYQAFFLLTEGALTGVFLAADLFTAYLFFEIMSLASWVWVAQNETEASRKAADTYLAIAIIGGLSMLYGLFVLQNRLGALTFEALTDARALSGDPAIFAAGVCILAGFGAKAGMFPLHIWLPKAHPVAPAPASALLSGILTKAGVFGILLLGSTLFYGNAAFANLVQVLGAVTMVLGALLALLSTDLKRTLACSSLSQIGFILVAASILNAGTAAGLAAAGAMTHAVNHALIKLVLFVSAGVIYKSRHTLDLNRLRGAGRGNFVLTAAFLIGALSIAGVPLFSGYASKTLIHEAIVESGRAAFLPWLPAEALEWLFLLSGGLTLAYMSKLFVRLFVEKGEGAPAKPDGKTAFALLLPAALLCVMGWFPDATLGRIAAFAAPSLGVGAETAAFFSLESLKGAAISVAIGLAVYLLVVRLVLTDRKRGEYRVVRGVLSLEDDAYKPILAALTFVGSFAARVCYSLAGWVIASQKRLWSIDRTDRVVPGTDDHFAHYSRKYVGLGRIVQTLSFELLLFGVGVMLTLFYLLLG